MATSNKVFVSPGVYTSEVDLSFVSSSVGVTTLGIVGETLKGPAFEPIFITNFDEFSTYFGGTSPEKFVNTQIPKYEAAYIAKAYLQQSNQLFVTRILGLSGYDAGPSWSITTIANVDQTTVGFDCTSAATLSCITQCVEFNVVPYSIDFTGCTSGLGSITFTSSIPNLLSGDFNSTYEKFDGSTSVISTDLKNQILGVINTPSSSAYSINYFGVVSGDTYDTLLIGYTASTNVFGVDNVSSNLANYSAPVNDTWYYATFDNIGNNDYTGYSFYNVVNTIIETSSKSNCASFYTYEVSSSTISTVFGAINYNTNTINVCLPASATTADTTAMTITFSACTTGVTSTTSVGTTSAITTNFNFSSTTQSYTLTSQDGTAVSAWTVNLLFQDPCGVCTTGNTGSIDEGIITTCYSGNVSGEIYVYTGKSFTDYDNLVIATLRSRGLATYGSDDGAVYEVDDLSNVTLDCSGTYSAVTTNPFATFGINVTNKDNENFFFETSFTNSDTKYLSKVFGKTNFGKPRTTTPLFVEEEFYTLLNYAYRKGYIRGLNCDLIALPNARQGIDTTSIAWYLERYQSPSSPWVVSELRGNKVFRLFKFVTIADGDAANTEVKISIRNISFNNGTFDVIVRDFFDTDANPVVLESFTNLAMNPNENNFIAQRIGTVDGEYQLNSKYIMIEMNMDAPFDALPCGFEGYTIREYDQAVPPFPPYKTKYDFAGEVVFNPPFGSGSGADDAVTSAGDNVRRTYLGISDTVGIDVDMFTYKGKQLPINVACDTTGDDWAYKTKGYHMDINASGITIQGLYITSGTPEFFVGASPFTSDPTNETNQYYRLFARKFTLLCQGGFDGWDIYREYRTNADRFVIGKAGYLKGASPSCSTRYPSASGWGAFKQITVGDNTQDFANTDYYAYLLGQQTFSNPEAVNINVFVTPGIDYYNNSNLAEAAIEMIEFDRADSIYIITTPDYNMFVPSLGDNQDMVLPQEAVDRLEDLVFDSNYTATYYPWVLTRDSVNNTQIYLPPTAEVCRNLALTDNIAFPWFAAAGYTRGIVNAVKARKKLTQEDRDTLYKGRINPIATFSDVGTVIWGNKTMQIRESALDRINVRRLLLQARKLISAVSVRLLFEQNDEKVRQDFLDAVNPILDSIRRDRGLFDFRVTVSSDPADLDRNQLTGKIYIKPTRSLEFIDITFYITPTGASFENI
jgi:hypothetical protein